MKLTVRTEYALLALTYLARHADTGFIATTVIAHTQKIPQPYLVQILLILKQNRYIHSLKGQHGGYALAKKPEDISLAEIIRLFDGALAPTISASKLYYGPTPLQQEKKILFIMKDIREYLAKKLENTSLAEVC